MVKEPYYLSSREIELVQDYLSSPSAELEVCEVVSALCGATSILLLGADDPESAYVPRYVRDDGDPSCLSAELEGAGRVRKCVLYGQDIQYLYERLQDAESQYDAFAERMLNLLYGVEIVRISYARTGDES